MFSFNGQRMNRFETVVVSDVHLGARNSRTTEFLQFLDRVEADRLIIAGDLFDSPRVDRLRPGDLLVLRMLRRISRQTELVWLRGNHDPDGEFAHAVLGLEQREEMTLAVGNRRYLVVHGDRWDRSLELPRLVIGSADAIYRGCQWLDPTHQLARSLKRRSKRFCQVVEALRCAALREARQRRFDGVILGHTHVANDHSEYQLHFLNSGCWTERPTSYVGIRGDRARQYFWDAALVGQQLPAGLDPETAALATVN